SSAGPTSSARRHYPSGAYRLVRSGRSSAKHDKKRNQGQGSAAGMTLELRNVTYRVGADLFIGETSLVLEEGSFNILLGPTLAGKTTLMQIMAGLIEPTSGEIWFRGRNVGGVPVQKRNVAM